MSSVVIKAESIGKLYKLGEIGTGTISHDLNRWWARLRGKEDPFLKIGETNDRTAKGYSDWVWALKDINFEVKQGEVLGVIGRNGAGKSTLLKILSKVTKPTTGRIKTKGRIASLLEVGTGFHPELTGRENIFLNGAILGMSKSEIRSKFDEIVDFSGVERYIDTPVKRYSSGMYVRLAFAVAAFLEPEILIIDEVLAVGDAEFQKKCLGRMKDVSTNDGRTVLFVSHNMGAVNALCNRAMLLEKGLIAAQGNVEQCVQLYLTETTRGNQGLDFVAKIIPRQPAYIKQINLKGTEQFGETLFDVHTQLTITVKIIVTQFISGTTPYFDLKCNNEVLYRSFASDGDARILDGIGPGEYNFSSTLHSPLKKGRYSIDVRLIKITDLFYDEVNDAVAFEIDEVKNDLLFKSYWHKRPGLVAFNNAWQVRQTP